MRENKSIGYIIFFFGLAMAGSLIYSLVTSWSAILASGILAIGVFLFYLIFIPIGLLILVVGILLLDVVINPEAKYAKFKNKITELGFETPYKVVVFDDSHEKADNSTKSYLKYRYYGRDYVFTPAKDLSHLKAKYRQNLPSGFRFDYKFDPIVNHLLVFDLYDKNWYVLVLKEA